MEQIKATGRRKSAVARVILTYGTGKMTVNKKDYKVYFPVNHIAQNMEMPFQTVSAEGKYDVRVNVRGGGVKGQSEAIRMAICRALCEDNPEFRPPLKARGFLKRDARVVERKKPGLRKARKAMQYSKR